MDIYEDKLLRASIVVEHGERLWLVPKAKDGWTHRLPMKLTEEARAERLRPARGISAAWLGVVEAEAAT